ASTHANASASVNASANANANADGDMATPATHDAASSHYWQEYLPGESYGVVFLAAGGQADLWGITALLVGRNWPHDSPHATNPATNLAMNLAMNLANNPATAAELLTRANFDYAGSIGPLSFSAELETEIQRIGKTIARLGNLSGIFGVDLLIPSSSLATPQPTTTAQIFVLEVNPRWTASVEILERATGQNAFQLHQAACTQGQLLPPRARAAASLHGKLVVYAEKQLEVSSALSDRWLDRAQGQTWPTLADIPRAGEMIPAGAPICTLFASGLTPADVATQLQTARAELRRG
ncbi:MAG: ATP-grasp domain-containing protein, partial [Planctomycetota bacterium]